MRSALEAHPDATLQSTATSLPGHFTCVRRSSDPGRVGHARCTGADFPRKRAFLCNSQGTWLTSCTLYHNEAGHTQNHYFADGERERDRKTETLYWVTYLHYQTSQHLFVSLSTSDCFTGTLDKINTSLHTNLPRRTSWPSAGRLWFPQGGTSTAEPGRPSLCRCLLSSFCHLVAMRQMCMQIPISTSHVLWIISFCPLQSTRLEEEFTGPIFHSPKTSGSWVLMKEKE